MIFFSVIACMMSLSLRVLDFGHGTFLPLAADAEEEGGEEDGASPGTRRK